jgi:hypothetical protein
MLDDLLGELIGVLIEGGIPGPLSLEGQRRARVVVSTVALVGILTGHLFLASLSGTVVLVVGSVVAAWILAFSLVDLAKELPGVPWVTVVAILVAVAGLITGVGLALRR